MCRRDPWEGLLGVEDMSIDLGDGWGSLYEFFILGKNLYSRPPTPTTLRSVRQFDMIHLSIQSYTRKFSFHTQIFIEIFFQFSFQFHFKNIILVPDFVHRYPVVLFF